MDMSVGKRLKPLLLEEVRSMERKGG